MTSLLRDDSPHGSPEPVAGPAVDVDALLDGQHQQHHVPVLAGQQEVVLQAEDVGGHFLNLSVSRASAHCSGLDCQEDNELES